MVYWEVICNKVDMKTKVQVEGIKLEQGENISKDGDNVDEDEVK